jgi:2-oxoglutarate ferredoxin oxidoreductase subunit delta
MSEQTNAKGYHPPEIIDSSHCVNCGLCALLCPDFAIFIEDKGDRTPAKIESKRKTEVSK